MDTMLKPEKPDYAAPDGSEIRLLPSTPRGGLAHCTLPVGRASKPVQHRTVEEIWYCIRGAGQLWRKYGQTEDVTDLRPGVACVIPFQTAFQFRTCGADEYAQAGRQPESLELLIATFPGWPGPEEAIDVTAGRW